MSSSTTNQLIGDPSAQPNFHEEIVVNQIDGWDNDLDSTLGADASLRSTSLTASIYAYRYENGRRYHAYRDGKYLLPNDEAEQDRLDLNHHVYTLILGGQLFRAPISSNPQRVLDIGTGTGAWAIDVADEFASAVVVGTDLSPIQPGMVPPNCIFYVDDFESEWTFGLDEAFDFIHGRGISHSVKDFGLLYSRIYHNLKPGGWVEINEYESYVGSDDDPNLEKIPNIVKWMALCKEAGTKFGKSISSAPEQKQYMIDAGFYNVSDKIYKVPIGPWPVEPKLKEIGMYQREVALLSVESFTLGFLSRVNGWSNDECQVLMAEVRREMRDPENHLYNVFHCVIGRRPDVNNDPGSI